MTLLSTTGFTKESVLDTFFVNASPIADADALESWSILINQMEAENVLIQACLADTNQCEGRLKSVSLILKRSAELNRIQKIRLVNRYINRFTRYRSDRSKVVSFEEGEIRVSQQWVSLLEFLRRGGDCEDYATAKFQLLRQMGFNDEDLQIVVVYDRTNREHHALIAVRENSEKALLLDADNRIYSRRPFNYRYVYAVNENSVWDHGIEDTRFSRQVRRLLEQR